MGHRENEASRLLVGLQHAGIALGRARLRTIEWELSRCGAHCKKTGQPCRARAMANGRCKYHGGTSTGPKTAEGKRRALGNLRQYREVVAKVAKVAKPDELATAS